MNMKVKNLVAAFVAAGSVIGLGAISTAAEAGSWWGGSPTPFSVTCQSETVGGVIQNCGSGDNPEVLVPWINKKCFFLTDFTAYNNNPVDFGGRRVDLRDVTNGRGSPPKVVYFLPYDSAASANNGGSTTVQSFQTPLVFTGNVYADVGNGNNNVFVTVSGYYDRCPK